MNKRGQDFSITENDKNLDDFMQVTFCDSPIIMTSIKTILVPEANKFARNAPKIFQRNDLLNKNSLRESRENIDFELIK